MSNIKVLAEVTGTTATKIRLIEAGNISNGRHSIPKRNSKQMGNSKMAPKKLRVKERLSMNL